jgi:hypothetical protein
MATPEKWNEEEAKSELLALVRHLRTREPIAENADYREGWDDLYAIFAEIIEAPGYGLPPDSWRKTVEQMTRNRA